MIKDNLTAVRRNIAAAAVKSGRKPEDVTLVCVTKQVNIDRIKEAIGYGIVDIGENRVQDAVARHSALRWTPVPRPVLRSPQGEGGSSKSEGGRDDGRGRAEPALARRRRAGAGEASPKGTIRWHLIGHLQTNKVKKAVEIFNLIHSVDSFHLAQAISREAARINKTQDILIQVNTSGEASKFGIEPEELKPLIDNIVGANGRSPLRNIRILGLMTIAPLVDNPEKARPCFRKLKLLFDEINIFLLTTYDLQLTTVSMGMSNDYQIAIEEGATMVRIGSAIFK